MSTTTHVSPVSGVPARLADQAKASMGRRRCLTSSPPSRPVSLANPLADVHSGLLLSDLVHALVVEARLYRPSSLDAGQVSWPGPMRQPEYGEPAVVPHVSQTTGALAESACGVDTSTSCQRCMSGSSVTHMDSHDEAIAGELERRFNSSWQGWHLDKDNLTLWHETLSDSRGYTIDLLRCTTSAALLGWIMEISAGVGMPIVGLVRAFDDIFQPRINLCLDGETRSRRLSRRKIHELVAAAQEPPPV